MYVCNVLQAFLLTIEKGEEDAALMTRLLHMARRGSGPVYVI